jgi:hypothetical protein
MGKAHPAAIFESPLPSFGRPAVDDCPRGNSIVRRRVIATIEASQFRWRGPWRVKHGSDHARAAYLPAEGR